MALSIEEKRARRRAYYHANKELEAAQAKSYRERNREKINARQREYHKENKEVIAEKARIYCIKNREKLNSKAREYAQLNKGKIRLKDNERRKKKRAEDPLFKLKGKIRGAIGLALRSKDLTKSKSSKEILGLDVFLVFEHLKQTWFVNYGNPYTGQEYNLDHIVPMSTAVTTEDVIRLNHYTNLQMLTPEDNNIKSDRLDYVTPYSIMIGIHKNNKAA